MRSAAIRLLAHWPALTVGAHARIQWGFHLRRLLALQRAPHIQDSTRILLQKTDATPCGESRTVAVSAFGFVRNMVRIRVETPVLMVPTGRAGSVEWPAGKGAALVRKGGGWLPVRPIKVERIHEAHRAFRQHTVVQRGGGGRAVDVGGVEWAGVADAGRDGRRWGLMG
jgi:hypothetical protein